jgi:hypothetical protein
MGDHARFIKGSLSPDQASFSMVAENFIQIFDRFYERVSRPDDHRETSGLIGDINTAVLSLREFKRELLSIRLQNRPVTSLGPTFYNHMLNELEDFLKILADYQAGKANTDNVLGLHLLWSLDAAAHAAILGADLDKVEYRLQKLAKDFEKRFDHLYIKAVELTGYFRSKPPAAGPALERFNLEIAAEIQKFMEFLIELCQGVIHQQILGRMLPLEPDHMWREECYYLRKIAEVTPEFPMPDCDPGRVRIS